MRRTLVTLAAIAALGILPSLASAQVADAKDLAQKVLDQGAATFSTKDARAMAATYTEDAVVFFLHKDSGGGRYTTEEHRGKNAIEDYYKQIFDGQEGQIVAKNTVEAASLLAPDIMLIQGRFQPNVNTGLSVQFVQVRVKQDGVWLMKTLHLFPG